MIALSLPGGTNHEKIARRKIAAVNTYTSRLTNEAAYEKNGEDSEERVARRLVESAAPLARGDAPGDRGVEREAEGDEEGGAAEVSHVASLAGWEQGSFCDHCSGFVLLRLRHIPLPALATSAVVLMGAALALVFFYAPIDADQGLCCHLVRFEPELSCLLGHVHLQENTRRPPFAWCPPGDRLAELDRIDAVDQ